MITCVLKCYFKFRIFILLVQTKKVISDLWHKQLKTMEMTKAWPSIYDERYTHQFQPDPTHKIHWQQQKHIFKKTGIHSMKAE